VSEPAERWDGDSCGERATIVPLLNPKIAMVDLDASRVGFSWTKTGFQ
jgi:hypothetical protein